MSSERPAIRIEGLSKCFNLYARPSDRLKQMTLPKLARIVGARQKHYFEPFWALHNVNLEVRHGETVGIVGRNGSGKSTLLQLVCGTLAPTGGRIEIEGRISALLELGSGFNPEFTGRENIYLNATVLGLSRDEIDERFEAIESFAGIGAFLDQPIKVYSSGMIMRVAFATAINVDPRILIVDEALAVGDELFQRKCFSRIEELRKQGVTILFVSHSASAVVEICDRAILLDGGEKIADGEPKQIVSMYQRLLYANPHEAQRLRGEFKEKVEPEPTKSAVAAEDIDEGFDPNLVPTSTVEYQSHGVRIHSISIRTLDGRSVNNLVQGRRYIYCYRASFEENLDGILYGMMIKNTAGVELGGAAETYLDVTAGTEHELGFEFSCNLNTGLYFMNAGIQGHRNGERTFLHRVIDAACFRVQPAESNATGFIDFNCVGLHQGPAAFPEEKN